MSPITYPPAVPKSEWRKDPAIDDALAKLTNVPVTSPTSPTKSENLPVESTL